MSRIVPILFNTNMVRAILDNRKTVTRRVVKFVDKKNPNWTGYKKDGIVLYNGKNEICNKRAPYQTGDILYIRETWNEWDDGYIYKAWDEPFPQPGYYPGMTWHPSIHMPKEAARIWLKVTDVRAERLQNITDEQAIREGLREVKYDVNTGQKKSAALEWFPIIWDSTIKKADIDRYGWDANPWVWVIEFERCEKPEEG